MGRRTLFVDELAQQEIFEIAQSMWAFDQGAATRFALDLVEDLSPLCEHPHIGPLVSSEERGEIRKFLYKHATLLYLVLPDAILILHVFGPGRDWQGEL